MRKLFNERLWVLFLLWTVWLVRSSAAATQSDGNLSYSQAANLSPAETVLFSAGPDSLTPAVIPTDCTYSLDPTSRVHDYPAVFDTFNVIAPDGCDWTVDNQNVWMAIKLYTNGTGNGIVRYAVFVNLDPIERTGIFTVNGQIFTVTQLPAPCGYSILPTNYLFGAGAASSSVRILTAPGCAWSVSNTNAWITINSATNGSDGASVIYSVAPNYSPSDRTAVMTIAGLPFTVAQFGTSCRYSFTNRVQGFGATTGAVVVTAGMGCSWSVANTNDWLTLTSSTNGSGNGSILYRLAANPTSLTRTSLLSIVSQLVPVIQTGAPCTNLLAPTTRAHGFGLETGAISVTAPIGCNWTIRNTNQWITLISGTNGVGSVIVSYQVNGNSGRARTGVLFIGGSRFTITQAEATAPVITAVPASQMVLAGTAVALNAGASGSVPLSYQWQFNGVNLVDGPSISGSATPRLTLLSAQWWQAGSYSLIASNIRASVTSAPPAILLVNTAPIFAPLANKTINQGAPLAFKVIATDPDIPAQTLTYSLIGSAPSGAAIDPVTGLFTWPVAQTLSTNQIAVRATDNGSPPLSATQTFAINVVAAFMTNSTLVATGAVWKYRDTGQDLGSAWTAAAFDDSTWASGPAKLGYGSGTEATTVSYGPSSSSKYLTTYFRRAFTLADSSTFSALNLRLLRVDGAVVYLNGSELYRDNMPGGPVNYLTKASSSASSSAKSTYLVSPVLDSGSLVTGQSSKFAPAVAVFQKRLWLAFVANNDSNQLLVCHTSDGATWTGADQITNQSSKFAPSLVATDAGLL